MSDSISQENFMNENMTNMSHQSNSGNVSNTGSGVNRRQKSWDLLDQSAIAQARQHKQPPQHQVSDLIESNLYGVVNCCY